MASDEQAAYAYLVRVELDSGTTLGVAKAIYEALNGYGGPTTYSTIDNPKFIVYVEGEDDFELGFNLAVLMQEIRDQVQSYGFGMIDHWSPVDDSPPVPNGGQPSLT